MFEKVDQFFFGEMGNCKDRCLFYGTLISSLSIAVSMFILTKI